MFFFLSLESWRRVSALSRSRQCESLCLESARDTVQPGPTARQRSLRQSMPHVCPRALLLLLACALLSPAPAQAATPRVHSSKGSRMRAITQEAPGGPSTLRLEDTVAVPTPHGREVSLLWWCRHAASHTTTARAWLWRHPLNLAVAAPSLGSHSRRILGPEPSRHPSAQGR